MSFEWWDEIRVESFLSIGKAGDCLLRCSSWKEVKMQYEQLYEELVEKKEKHVLIPWFHDIRFIVPVSESLFYEWLFDVHQNKHSVLSRKSIPLSISFFSFSINSNMNNVGKVVITLYKDRQIRCFGSGNLVHWTSWMYGWMSQQYKEYKEYNKCFILQTEKWRLVQKGNEIEK